MLMGVITGRLRKGYRMTRKEYDEILDVFEKGGQLCPKHREANWEEYKDEPASRLVHDLSFCFAKAMFLCDMADSETLEEFFQLFEKKNERESYAPFSRDSLKNFNHGDLN